MAAHKCFIGFACLVLSSVLTVSVAAAAEGGGVIDEVARLLEAEVGEEVILAYVAAKGAPDEISAADLVTLKKAGAGEAVLIALLGKGVQPAGKGKASGFPFELDDTHLVHAPVLHGLMAVFPVARKTPVDIGSYITLEEAQDRKSVVIREKGGGSVPVVIIVNNGDLPIYIAAGEIIIGGKQDRIVAYDVIVRPHRELTVEVRCVEQGRWRGDRMEFAPARAMGGRRTKMAAQFAAQQDVWHSVASVNRAAAAESSTGTYQAALRKPEVRELHRDYAEALLPALDGRDIVGMVVAINGKVHAVELFGSPRLFARMKTKLLKGYVLDVVGVDKQNADPPGQAAIIEFYRKAVAARAEELKAYSDNRNLKRESSAAAVSEALDADGNLLHRSLLAH